MTKNLKKKDNKRTDEKQKSVSLGSDNTKDSNQSMNLPAWVRI